MPHMDEFINLPGDATIFLTLDSSSRCLEIEIADPRFPTTTPHSLPGQPILFNMNAVWAENDAETLQ